MSRREKKQRIIDEAYSILSAFHPMTVRQVYYQLVSRQVIENNRSAYQGVSDALVEARREDEIPWAWIEDRLRRPRAVNMWDNLADFAKDALSSYKRDIWPEQESYLEVWLEKDALSGIFIDVLLEYGVTLNVGRGYDGWSSIYNASERFACYDDVTVLYFGDFDPSGDDMVRSLEVRLADLESYPDIIKVALTREDIQRYRLPPNLTKPTDSRRAAFVAKNGDLSVELDALEPAILRARLTAEVERHMDLDALEKVREVEKREFEKLGEALREVS